MRRTRNLSYAVFYQAADEGGYVALIPALPGCHSQGETIEEAERSIKEAIEVYVASLAAHGEAVLEEQRMLWGRVQVVASAPVTRIGK